MASKQPTTAKPNRTTKRTAASGRQKQWGNISEDERRHMVAEAAYFHAQQRGFSGTDTDNDWYLAEAEIDAMLTGAKPH